MEKDQSMKNTLAIIGATGFALDRVVPALRNSRRCEVAAIQGRNAERTRRAAQEFEIPHWYVDVEEMLGSKTYDAVYIATPPFLHLSDIETAMQHSLPIICEKPLCVSLSEALRIQALLRGKSAVAFMLAHHMRHQRALRELRNAITQGRIGEAATVWIQ